MCQPTFREHGGLPWIELGPEWPGFTEALNDGVSALSPRGQAPALSTYWIDYALEGIGRAVGEQITGGNATSIVRSAMGVTATSDYELFDDETMTADDFVRVLTAWRDVVTTQIGNGNVARLEQAPYQRNPHR